MTTILLVRHGETDWNRELRFQGRADPPLNEKGRRQARELAATLAAGDPVGALYSSPLRRARETAEIVAERLGLPVGLDDALVEVDVGEWSGLTRAELEERDPAGLRRWLDGQEGWREGETFDELAVRVAGALERIAARHPGERVVAVTHGGAIRAIHARCDGVSIGEARRRGPSVHNCSLFGIAVGSDGFRKLD